MLHNFQDNKLNLITRQK